MGTDFCAEMLESAPAKAARLGLEVSSPVADALALPYPDASFDVSRSRSGSGTWRSDALPARDGPGGEARRERDRTGIWPAARSVRALFRAYSRGVMPVVGGLLTGNRAAYQYLPRTAAAFPAGRSSSS